MNTHAVSRLNRARAIAFACAIALPLPGLRATELWVGATTTDITPDQPVALDGHRNLRISTNVQSRITATALALESREGEKVVDQAVIVSCDIVAIRSGILDAVRKNVAPKSKGLDVQKIILCATHTHNAPVTVEGRYTLPETGIMKPAEYAAFMTDRLAKAISESWNKRQLGKVGWGQSQAVIAHNRRAAYADGTAKMYGATDAADFRGIEGHEDHDLDALFFWDGRDQLVATLIAIPCPAQEGEGGLLIHSDFWDATRRSLRERHGKNLCILGCPGAGGDQTSRPLYGKPADARMRELRGLTRMEEIARRIVNGWEDAYDAAKRDMRRDVALGHRAEVIELPHRKVTEQEVAEARSEAQKFANDPKQRWNLRWHQGVIDRYDAQKAGGEPPYKMELHAIRIGDVAIATNEFELFTDYGVQIKARSPAIQTFVIQLACGSGGYLPTERAVRGGGYGAVIQSSRVGPDGGQVLVDRSVDAIKGMWPQTATAKSPSNKTPGK